MLRVEMLPAEYGDALWIEYGSSKAPHRILVDCGTSKVYDSALEDRITALPEGQRTFELFVVSHVDSDHIGGALKLLANRERLGLDLKEVWFNGYKQLVEHADILGPVEGEALTQAIVRQRLPWNESFGGHAVVVPDSGALRAIPLAGGMKLTLLSPYRAQLDALQPVWNQAVRKAGLIPGQPARSDGADEGEDLLGAPNVTALANTTFEEDHAESNGSSIAFLAQYRGKSVLLAADAHAPVLLRSLKRLSPFPVKVEAVKVGHHGSTHNTNLDLVRAVVCRDFLVSTNGKRFSHPSQEAIARIIAFGNRPTLHFNYRTRFNEPWDDATLKRQFHYATSYPEGEGLAVDIG